MLSLKNLAAEAVPEDALLTNLHEDVVAIIQHNKPVLKTCKHGTIWSFKRYKINGSVTYTCGCVEEWHGNEWIHDIIICEERVGSEWGCVGCGCVCGVEGRRMDTY